MENKLLINLLFSFNLFSCRLYTALEIEDTIRKKKDSKEKNMKNKIIILFSFSLFFLSF